MGRKPDFTNVYKSEEGCEITADVYIPSAREHTASNARSPLIINIHGGAYMLGASSMVNNDQIIDCLERGWIVIVPNHRLCPQIDVLEGPITDIRDLSHWIHEGRLDRAIQKHGFRQRVDLNSIFAFGTSAGGHLAMCLGFDHPHPPKAILSFYGPSNFNDPFWTSSLPMASKLPSFPADFLQKVYDAAPIPTEGGISLEGQSNAGPDFRDPRVAFAMTQIAHGKVWDVCYPSKDFAKIDPVLNVSEKFPPTCIVHGTADTMVPMRLSRMLYEKLQEKGVRTHFVEVEGEEHTFAGKMVKGSKTWETQRKGFDWLERV